MNNNKLEGISTKVNRDLLNLVFNNMYLLVIGESLGVIAVMILLWPWTNHILLILWAALNLTADGAARLMLIYSYQHTKPIPSDQINKWYKMFIGSAVAGGLIWMLASFLTFFTTSDIGVLIIIIALLAVIGAASAAFTPIIRSYFSVIIPVLAGMIIVGAAKFSPLFLIIIVTLIVYTLLISHYAMFYSNSINSLLWLRHKHEALFDNMLEVKHDLEAANLRLSNEVKARHKAEKSLQQMATHDHLTGLPNRNLLQIQMAKAIAHSRRYKSYSAVLFLDLDNFKNVNDTFGHGTGDKLLKLMAKRLEKNIRSTDILARIGGDEFIITLCEITDATAINYIARKICKSVSRRCIINNHDIEVTTSIGISIFPKDGDSIETLLQTADRALYQAKSCGKNNFVFFNEEDGNTVAQHLHQE